VSIVQRAIACGAEISIGSGLMYAADHIPRIESDRGLDLFVMLGGFALAIRGLRHGRETVLDYIDYRDLHSLDVSKEG
jgi:hypothetical protein